MMTKGLTDSPFDRIAIDCTRQDPFRDRQPQTRMFQRRRGVDDLQPACGQAPSVTIDSRKLPSLGQSVAARKAKSAQRLDGLGGQLMATLGSTRVDHATTTLGCHTGAKTVGTLTLDYAGLKRAFHV